MQGKSDAGETALDCIEKLHNRLVEQFWLIDIRRMTGFRDHYLGRIWDLCGHVIRGGEERRVVGADDNQRRDPDVRQRLDHAVVALRQHAPSGPEQATCRAV